MSKKELAFIGAWGADLQGVNNPEAGDGGIKVYAINEQGEAELSDKVTPQVNAGSISVSSSGAYLYATDERKDLGGVHGNGGGICAYKINSNTGELTFLNEVSSAGAYPCYITVDSKSRYAFASNHGNHEEVITKSVRTANGTYVAKRFFDEGSIAMFPILPDGSLGECCELKALEGNSILPLFQWTSHPHSVCLDPTEKFLLCGDKGCDLIRVFKIDYANGKLTAVWEQETERGSGPRHLVFHPTLPVVYCNSEQNHTVHAYLFDFETGRMAHSDRAVTVPDEYTPSEDTTDIFAKNQTADICLHKSGQYLYVSNRGHNSVATYRLDEEGKMTLIGIYPSGGEIPRSMNFDKTGDSLYVVNQRTGNIAKFTVEGESGALAFTGISINVDNPASIQFSAVKAADSF